MNGLRRDASSHPDYGDAYRKGREAGAVAANQAGACPYGVLEPARMAWMDGFSEGRADRQTAALADPL